MTKIGDNSFVFKLDDGKMKKIFLSMLGFMKVVAKNGKRLRISSQILFMTKPNRVLRFIIKKN